MNAMSTTIAICTGASGVTFGTTNSLLGFGARELCGPTYMPTRYGCLSRQPAGNLEEAVDFFLEAGLNGHHQALGLGYFTNQVAAKNRLIGGRVLQSRGELDGVASP